MFKSIYLLSSFFSLTSAALFQSYYDNLCTKPIQKTLAFTDVCTWTSNEQSGSWSLYLNNCSNDTLNTLVFNLGDAPTCQGTPNFTIPITSNCNKFDNVYVKGLDFTCNSNNNSFNILSHFQSDCKDGGIPFTIQLGEPTCQGHSFAPSFFNWDTEGSFSNPYYQMNIYNTTDGSCQDKQSMFETTSFPAQCLAPVLPFNNIYLDIYNSFHV